MRLNGILSLFSFCDVCSATVDQFVGRDDGPLEQQKQDSNRFVEEIAHFL